MKLGTITCVFNEADIIESCVKSAYPYVDRMVLLVAAKPLYNRKPEPGDNSLKVVKRIPDPKGKIEIVTGNWTIQWKQRQEGLRKLRQAGMTHCIVLDADEFYTKQGWRDMRGWFERDEADVLRVRMTHFWRSFHYRLVPKKPEYLVVAYKIEPSLNFVKRVSRGPLYGNRAKTLQKRIRRTDIVMYHLSYARPLSKLRQKFRTNGALQRGNVNAKKFLQKVEGWEKNRGMTRLHPLVPGMWERAKKYPLGDLPKALRNHKYAGMDIIR